MLALYCMHILIGRAGGRSAHAACHCSAGWDEDEDGQWESPKIENPTFTSLKEMSSSLSDYRWAYSSTPEVLAKLKSKGNGLYLYRSPKFVSKEHGDRPREVSRVYAPPSTPTVPIPT